MIIQNHLELEPEDDENEDPDFKEFQDLINPFIPAPQGAIFDKDFEPKDPGWPYPDQDWGFEDKKI